MNSRVRGPENFRIGVYHADAVVRFPDPGRTGLTLVELMIVMLLSLVLVGSAFMAYIAHSKTSKEQHEVASMQQDMRAVMDMIDRDVRNSGCTDPRFTTISAFQASGSGPNSLMLYMDLNLDGNTSATGERVAYGLSGKTLQRTDQSVTADLISNVTTFGIIYYGLNNTTIVPSGMLTQAQAGNVLSVEVTLGMESKNADPDTGQKINKVLRRRMQSRNQEIVLKGM